jgi:ribose/xylose/arabinose/galactoside ABC-type transport system permease subunit
MLASRVLAIILRTAIALSLRTISGSTIIVGALRELIVRLKKIVVVRGVKLLKRGGARGKGKRSAKS